MNEQEQYEMVCQKRFDDIDAVLKSIMEALYLGGNKDSIVVRLDRLEQSKRSAGRAFWIAITAFVTVVVNLIVSLVKK